MANKGIFFNEVYGTYYRLVEAILRRAQSGRLKRSDIDAIVCTHGFQESSQYIPRKLKEQEWPLLTAALETPLQAPVSQPLTLLEKCWLRALLLDARIRLFDVDDEGLEDVEPLFRPEQLVYFDQYTDGDAFTDEAYQQRFRLLLKACEEKCFVELEFTNNMGEVEKHVYLPLQLEYSAKDDKFRLRAQKQAAGECGISMVNLGRLSGCVLLEQSAAEEELCCQERCTLELMLTDERNALERVLLHFSGMEKRTQKLDDNHYRLQLTYNKADALELVIRVLSFGPLLKLVRPEELENSRLREQQQWFWRELQRRLQRQTELLPQ